MPSRWHGPCSVVCIKTCTLIAVEGRDTMQAFAPTMLLNSVGMSSGTGLVAPVSGTPAQNMGFENMLQGLLTGDATSGGGLTLQGVAGAVVEDVPQLTPNGSLQTLLEALAQALIGVGQDLFGQGAGQTFDDQMIQLADGNNGTELQQLAEYLNDAVSEQQLPGAGLHMSGPGKRVDQAQELIDQLLQQIQDGKNIMIENKNEINNLVELVNSLIHECAPDAVASAPGLQRSGAEGDTAVVQVGVLQDALHALQTLLHTHRVAGQGGGSNAVAPGLAEPSSGGSIPGTVLPAEQQQAVLPKDQSQVSTIGQQVSSAAGSVPAVKPETGLLQQKSTLQQAANTSATFSPDASKTGSLLLDQMLNQDMGNGSDTRDTAAFSLQRLFQPVVRVSTESQPIDTSEALSRSGHDTPASQTVRGSVHGLFASPAGEGLESAFSSPGNQPTVRPAVLSATTPPPAEQPGLNAQYLIDQISARIASGTRTSENHITLQLHPPTLGKVYVDLSLHDHQLRAVVFAENHHVKHVLEGSIDQLRAALEQHNIEVDKLTVDIGGQGNQFASLLRERSGQGRQRQLGPMVAQPDPVPAEALQTAFTPPGRVSGGSGGLDLFA